MLSKTICTVFLVLGPQLLLAQGLSTYTYSEGFSMEDGLVHTVVGDLITDQNDLLWIAVNGTLQLFDGDQFVDMGHLIHSSITSGFFGYEKGKNVFLLKEHILYKFTAAAYTADEAPHLKLPKYTLQEYNPSILYEDARYMYISHPNDSLYQVNKDALLIEKVYPFPHKPNRYTWCSIYVSPVPAKVVHYFDTNYLWCQFDLATGKTFVDTRCPRVGRGALASGDTLLVIQPNTMEIYTRDHKHVIPLPEPAMEFNGDYFMLSGRDSAFVSTRNAIYIFNLRTFSWVSKITRSNGPSIGDLKVRRMALDKTGHLYFSTFYTGIVKLYLSRAGFEYMGILGSKKYFVKCIRVSEKNNMVLAGTLYDGLLVFDTSGILKHHIKSDDRREPIKLISAIIKISDNRYLLFSGKTYDITFHEAGYTIQSFKASNKNSFSFYDSALEDLVHDRYFIFNHRQILEYRPGLPAPLHEIVQPDFGACIAATISGDQYVMSRLDELIFYDQSLTARPIKFNVPDFGYSRCIIPYGPGQYLVGTDLGLFLFDTLHPGATHTPIFNQRVYSILAGDQNHEFWFTTDFGLYRLDADLEYTRYSIESGLQENEFNTNSCYRSESGKLYFGGINGITAFYPGRVYQEDDQPSAFISFLNINGEVKERYIPPGHHPDYELAFDENVIRIRLLGRGLRSPRNYNFQYKIKELHDEWINLGHNMEIQFQLAPGQYTLYYHISDRFQADAIPRQEIRFHIHPPLYKRWWFIALLSLLPLYLLYYVMNHRRKRLAMKLAYVQELEHKLHEERMRISRDLHDNIGAQMATVKRGISFIIDHGDKLSHEQAENKMKDLESISTQINQELRDTIWAVQNEHIDVNGFITRLKNYIYQLVGLESHYRIVYDITGDLTILIGPYTALNLHRICQEALNNILKHAEATEIHISIENTERLLRIVIADNGKGYVPEDIKEGYGLGNIRNRARQIEATVYFNRLPHPGSSIEIIYEYHRNITGKTTSHG